MNANAARITLATLAILFASTALQAREVGPSYLRMHLNGSLHLNLGIERGSDDFTPVVASISALDVVAPDGDVLPANTLGITGRALIDTTMGKRKVLTISLHGVDGPGTYDILEHGGVIVYSDASQGIADWENVMGWAAGVDTRGSSGTVTITDVGDAVPGLGWPVKGHFRITVLGGPVFRSDYDKKKDQQEALMVGEFSWGL